MKAVFLILYIWHGYDKGGPALTISPMPSLSACEAVGRIAKDFADERRGLFGKAATFRCIEVPQ